jgi:hypothetical protein
MRSIIASGLLVLFGLADPAFVVAAQERADWERPFREAQRMVITDNNRSRADAANSRDLAPSQDSQKPTGSDEAGISCNWNGWHYFQTPLNCWRCRTHVDTLRTFCFDGVVTRIEKTSVCRECWTGN